MKINPYLNFNGNAEEAFNFYKSVFGGEFTAVMRFSDVPNEEHQVSDEEANKIMHISLPVGDAILMASDISESQGMKLVEGNNNYICLSPEDVAEGKRLFEKLSESGTVEMPYEKMFWGSYFASFKDKFGVCWMIDVAASE